MYDIVFVRITDVLAWCYNQGFFFSFTVVHLEMYVHAVMLMIYW